MHNDDYTASTMNVLCRAYCIIDAPYKRLDVLSPLRFCNFVEGWIGFRIVLIYLFKIEKYVLKKWKYAFHMYVYLENKIFHQPIIFLLEVWLMILTKCSEKQNFKSYDLNSSITDKQRVHYVFRTYRCSN